MIKDFIKNRNSWYRFFRNKIYSRSNNKTDKNKELVKYDTLLFGTNEESLDFTYSKCCNPIPGDEVFGFTTIREGIKVHRQDCPNALRLQSNFAYRIIKTKWIDSSSKKYTAILKVKGIDQVGLINRITELISNTLKINIESLNISSSDGIFEGTITVIIKNKNILREIINKIKSLDGIASVSRKFKSN